MSPVWDAVFLDRDGTINVGAAAGEYVTDPDSLELLPGAAEAIARLNRAGSEVLVVTNQRALALGLVSAEGVDAVNRRLQERLATVGAWLDAVYVCPHGEGACTCRKPADGLLRQAFAARAHLRPSRCAIVGDSAADTAAGTALGLTRVRLAGRDVADANADLTVPDLGAAVDWLLARRRPGGMPR